MELPPRPSPPSRDSPARNADVNISIPVNDYHTRDASDDAALGTNISTTSRNDVNSSVSGSGVGFLSLSVELRLMIYEYLMSGAGSIDCCNDPSARIPKNQIRKLKGEQLSAQLLRTCKTVYLEATQDVLYRNKKVFAGLIAPRPSRQYHPLYFPLPRGAYVSGWSKTSRFRKRIETLVLSGYVHPQCLSQTYIPDMRACSNLRRLELEFLRFPVPRFIGSGNVEQTELIKDFDHQFLARVREALPPHMHLAKEWKAPKLALSPSSGKLSLPASSPPLPQTLSPSKEEKIEATAAPSEDKKGYTAAKTVDGHILKTTILGDPPGYPHLVLHCVFELQKQG